MKQGILWALTALLAICGIYYALTSHFNFGNLCVWLLATASAGYALWWRSIDAWLLHTPPGRILLSLLAAGVLFYCTVLGVILHGQFAQTADGQERSLIVLGCAVNGGQPSRLLRCRLDAALEYWQAHPSVTVVVCGGQGPGETQPEGRVMAAWLAARGVPAGSILIDDTSTSTEQNFANAARLLATQGIDTSQPTAFVTNGFHCYRAAQYARTQGFASCRPVPAGLPATQILPCYLREVFALVYYWAFKSPDRGLMRRFIGFLWTGGPAAF